MADFNISSSCKSSNKNFPTAPASISFHCQQGCTLAFTPTNANCFGQNSLTVNPDGSLPVISPTPTQVTPTCTGSLPGTTGDVFDITFNAPEDHKKY
jgi:hypothetical protein